MRLIKQGFVLFSLLAALVALQTNWVSANGESLSLKLEKDKEQSAYIADASSTVYFGSDFTIETWFKLDSLPMNGENYSILTQWIRSSRGFVFTYSNYPVGNHLRFEAFNSQGVQTQHLLYPIDLKIDEWNHIAFSFDASSGMGIFYLNGIEISRAKISNFALNDSNADLFVGHDAGLGPSNVFDGQMDETRVWSTVRTEEEIANSMFKILDGTEPGLQAYWRFEGNLLDETPNGNHLTGVNDPQFVGGIEFEKSFDELIEALRTFIESSIDDVGVRKSYAAQINNIIKFYEAGKYDAVLTQLKILKDKVMQDKRLGRIDEAVSENILVFINKLIEKAEVLMNASRSVPLMTQVASPHPPESASWANNIYATTSPAWCGNTIAGCGCAITSLSMMSRGQGVTEGVDGEGVDPGSLNAWLIEHNGYTPGGSVIWNYALQYFSDTIGYSHFTFDHHNAVSEAKIARHVQNGNSALGYKTSKGHFFLLTDVLRTGGYAVNDPLWYNTTSTSQTKDIAGHVQDYGGSIDKANLFTFHEEAVEMPAWVEIHLGSPAELLLTDERGRRSGFDPETGEVLLEIPGSSYAQAEGIVSQDTYGDEVHLEKVLIVHAPKSDLYELDVIGTGEGEYHLTVTTSGGRGQYEREDVLGVASEGGVDSYAIDVASKEGHSQAADRLYELADQKVAEQPEVSARLREIADRLLVSNTAAGSLAGAW